LTIYGDEQVEPLVMVVVFIVAFIAGFFVISKIPSLLHTPLMSGTNALSGVNILGALVATSVAILTSSKVIGAVAIVFSMINVAGGFGVTERMLKMFKEKNKR